MKYKPVQKTLQIKYEKRKEMENFEGSNQVIYESKNVENRTNYCFGICNKKEKKIYLFPIAAFHRMKINVN